MKAKKKKESPAAPDQILYNGKTDHPWLSQFANIPVVLFYVKNKHRYLLHFANAESAFQYFKTKAAPFREKIITSPTAAKARYWGSAKSECPMREDWLLIRKKIMRRVLWAKYTQNALYGHMLIATDDAELIELAPWDKDGYWGVDNSGKGENNAGKLTMKVRSKLKGHKFDIDDPLYDMTKFI